MMVTWSLVNISVLSKVNLMGLGLFYQRIWISPDINPRTLLFSVFLPMTFTKFLVKNVKLGSFTPKIRSTVSAHFMKYMDDHMDVCFIHLTFEMTAKREAARLAPICKANSCCCRSRGQIVKFDSLVANKWRQMLLLVSSSLNARVWDFCRASPGKMIPVIY